MDIVRRIKEDILHNQLPKGVPLRQVSLSVRYGVSRIPIRDALLTLKAEGWLVPNGKAGVMIPVLNWKEAEDLYLMRAELECLLLDKAFDFINEYHLLEARGYLSELNRKDVGLVRCGELNWYFHMALYQAADRPTLQTIVRKLNTQAARYLGFQYGPLGYRKSSQDEHEEILQLIIEKDRTAALNCLRQHIKTAGVLLTNYLKS
ncbi:MAG: GntR family transcriptional regulator [Oceanospirillaceae bacterium]|nr:GntR family transcriptional regulator [Oceanospirillaceae bacterium]